MDTYKLFEVVAIVLGVVVAFGAIGFCIGVWLFSRETHIEPINVVPQRTHKFPKIDISVAYQNEKVGQVLGGRK